MNIVADICSSPFFVRMLKPPPCHTQESEVWVYNCWPVACHSSVAIQSPFPRSCTSTIRTAFTELAACPKPDLPACIALSCVSLTGKQQCFDHLQGVSKYSSIVPVELEQVSAAIVTMRLLSTVVLNSPKSCWVSKTAPPPADDNHRSWPA